MFDLFDMRRIYSLFISVRISGKISHELHPTRSLMLSTNMTMLVKAKKYTQHGSLCIARVQPRTNICDCN